MATTTGANALPVPQSGDTPDVVRDVTNLATAVDPLLGPFVCTSGTHPSSPTAGQRLIWETDTQSLLLWDGTAYQPFYSDTGWLTSGFTALSGFAITSQLIRKRMGIVSVQINLTTTSGLGAGDISNTSVCNMPTGWTPAQSHGSIGSTDGSGLTAYVSAAGQIIVTATDAAFGAGAAFNVIGMYML